MLMGWWVLLPGFCFGNVILCIFFLYLQFRGSNLPCVLTSLTEALWDGRVSKPQTLRTTLDCYADLKQSSLAVYNHVTAEGVES